MHIVRLAPFALLLFASPALATGGFECRTNDRSGIVMTGAIGHVIASPLISAQLRVGRLLLSTAGANPAMAIGRSWIDAREIRVDLTDVNATRFEAQLRVRMLPRGRASGTLVHGGRTRPVRCTIE